MDLCLKITDVRGREILDSRGNPTVEAEVTVEGSITGRAAVPSGASTGQFEAVELRDGETRYFGLGVRNAVKNINTKLKNALVGVNVLDQSLIDRILVETDAPYLTPRNVPGLPRTNVPQNIVYVVRELAKYMKVSEEALMEHARENTERIFQIEE